MKKRRKIVVKMCLFAMFLALAWLLPLLTGQIQQIGNMLCPMHIPILLAGIILGPLYGLALGLIAPITRTLIFGMPPIFPTSVCMSFELATYGFVSGLLFMFFMKNYKHNNKVIIYTYISLLISMILGRLVWGGCMYLCSLTSSSTFAFKAFISGALLNAWPGIILQLILIPLLIYALYKAKLLNNYNK